VRAHEEGRVSPSRFAAHSGRLRSKRAAENELNIAQKAKVGCKREMAAQARHLAIEKMASCATGPLTAARSGRPPSEGSFTLKTNQAGTGALAKPAGDGGQDSGGVVAVCENSFKGDAGDGIYDDDVDEHDRGVSGTSGDRDEGEIVAVAWAAAPWLFVVQPTLLTRRIHAGANASYRCVAYHKVFKTRMKTAEDEIAMFRQSNKLLVS
jgi:hypothetical protein